MKLNKAIELSKDAEASLRKHKFIDYADAIALLREAGKRIKECRKDSLFVGPGPLPGEDPIPDLAPSALRKQKLRESPIGEK